MRWIGAVCVALLVSGSAAAQTGGDVREFDACGVLVRGTGCVLFEGGGGLYVVVNTGDFGFGDRVRVIGTLDPDCVTICPEADGCIRGAEVYDPDSFPCGTPLPSFPGDIIAGACLPLSSLLLTVTVAGVWVTRRRQAECPTTKAQRHEEKPG